MPSIDPQTGKRLGGAAQKRQAKERQGVALAVVPKARESALVGDDQYPVHPDLTHYAPPPVAGVAAVEAWAASLNLACALAIESATSQGEVARLVISGAIIRELAKLRDRAFRAEQNLKLRRLRLGEEDGQDQDVPPLGDPVAIVLWSFHKLSRLAHDAAASDEWEPRGQVIAAKAFAASGMLPCKAALADTVARVRAKG